MRFSFLVSAALGLALVFTGAAQSQTPPATRPCSAMDQLRRNCKVVTDSVQRLADTARSDTAKKTSPTDSLQDRARAIFTREVSKTDLVENVCKRNWSVRRGTPEQFMGAVLEGSNFKFSSCAEFAKWLGTLEEVECAAGTPVELSYIMEISRKVGMNYRRTCRQKEMFLRENNSGLNILSLLCGNAVNNTELLARDAAVRTSEVLVDAPRTVQVPVTGRTDSLVVLHRFLDSLNIKVSGGAAGVKKEVEDSAAKHSTGSSKKRSNHATVKKDRTGLAIVVGALLIGAAIIWANSDDCNGICIGDDGKKSDGPVNSPNGMSWDTMSYLIRRFGQ